MKCPKCGFKNSEGSAFCQICFETFEPKNEKPVPVVPPDIAPSAEPAPPPKTKPVVQPPNLLVTGFSRMVVCKNHPDRPAEKHCAICGADFCKECLVHFENELVCIGCSRDKKNPGWTKYSREWNNLPKFKILYNAMFKLLEKGFWTLFGVYALGSAVQVAIILGVFFITGGGALLQKIITEGNNPNQQQLVNEIIQFFKNSSSILLTGGFIYLVSFCWTFAITLLALDSVDKEKKVPFTKILLQGAIKTLPMSVVCIVYILIVAAGLVLLIIPAFIFAVWFMFVFSGMVLEDTGFLEAFKRSKKLTTGFFWSINSRYCWFFFVAWLWMIVLRLVGLIPIIGPIISQTGNMFVGLLGMVFYYLVYQNLCEINPPKTAEEESAETANKIEIGVFTKTMLKGGIVVLIAAVVTTSGYFGFTYFSSYFKLSGISSQSKDMPSATEQFFRIYDINLLKRALNSKNIFVKKAAIERLGEIGDSKLTRLFVKMFDEETDIQMKASIVTALCRVGDSANVPKIREALKHSDPVIRISAALALGEKSDLASLEYIIQMLNDKDESVRVNVCEALRKFNNSTVVAPLREALKDPSPKVRVAALSSLCKIGGVKFIGLVTGALADPAPEVKDTARKLVNSLMCELTMDRILYDIRMGEKPVKIELMRIVAEAQEKTAMNAVMINLYDKDIDVKLSAIETLAKIGNKKIVPAIKSMQKREKNKKIKEALIKLESVIQKPASKTGPKVK
ncbi:MAG: HEAT repeat domain-containing protein [Elusimicrobiota bacterium]